MFSPPAKKPSLNIKIHMKNYT